MVDDPGRPLPFHFVLSLKNSLAARPHLENWKGTTSQGGTFLLPKSSFSKRPVDWPPRSSPRWVNVPSAAAAKEAFREVDKNRGVFEKKMVPMYLNFMFIIYLHVYSGEMVISMEQRHIYIYLKINKYIYMYTYHFDASDIWTWKPMHNLYI